MSILSGIIPPVLTPFHADGSLDLESLDTLVEHLVSGGVHGLFVLGSSGQVAYLTDEERDTVVQRVIAKADDRVPVVVGTADLTARRILAHARRAQAQGAAAIVVTAPLYALNNAAEIADHFRIIAAGVDIPLIAYDVPVRGPAKLGRDMLVQLGREGVIAGVKDSSGDDVAFRRLVDANRAAGSPLSISTGHEVMCDGMLLVGAEGCVPGLANVDPAGYVRLHDAAQRGDWEAARDEQDRINRLFEIAFVPQGRSGDAGGIGAFKAACAALGVIASGTMPAPIEALSGEEVAGVEAIVREVGLL
ncbi:MAG TPA: dihydrodipicolinate synthase family protein [Propionibacterium sp.]|nr:dihydrodipicolinate synthase family protein [Propionibacterium sp.]